MGWKGVFLQRQRKVKGLRFSAVPLERRVGHRLITVEVNNFAIFKVRPPTIIGVVICLAGAVFHWLICNWCDAVTDAVSRTLAFLSAISVWQNTIGVALTLKPLTMPFIAKSL